MDETAEQETAEQPLWRVTYTYWGYMELNLKATFYIRATDTIAAIHQSREALAVMFTQRGRDVLTLRAVKLD